MRTHKRIPMNKLIPDVNQPRKTFDHAAIHRLAGTLKSQGLIKPITVTFDAARDAYVIRTGENRFYAAQIAGHEDIECLVCDGADSEANVLAEQIAENLSTPLPPLDLATALSRLKKIRGCTWQEIGEAVGMSNAAVSRTVALLELPADIQKLIQSGQLPPASGYELSKLADDGEITALAETAVSRQWTRDEIAAEVANRRDTGKQDRTKPKRLSCRLDGGVSVTFSAKQAITAKELLHVLDLLRKEAKRLADSDADISALAELFKLAKAS